MVLGLSPNESTRALWSYDFQLEYTVSLTANSLKVDLKATNKHTDAFKCHTLFHTYFRIPSIVSARVTGYAGIPYIDKMRNCEVFVEDQAVIEIDREVDRVYMEKDTPMGDISIYKDPASLEAAKPVLTVKKYSAILDESGAKVADVPTDCVLWNPWIAKASSMPDLGGDAYPYFVCVEPGTVQDWVEVPAGKSLVLTNVFSV
jgi:glucose-6-phosphate 1-epimerase